MQEQQVAVFDASKVLRQTRVKPAGLVGSNRERPPGGPGPSIWNVCRFRLLFVCHNIRNKKEGCVLQEDPGPGMTEFSKKHRINC